MPRHPLLNTTVCTVCELHAESTFRIEGMDCREEVALIERRFTHLTGVEHFSADLIGQRLHVQYDAAKISAAQIASAVADAGMRAWLEHEAPTASTAEARVWQTRLLVASGVMLACGLAAAAFAAPSLVSTSMFAVSVAAGVPLTARKAWQALRLRVLDINVLMIVAASGAIAIGQWSEAAAVVFLFAIAQTLESRTLERARLAVQSLMEVTPLDALVRDRDGDRKVPVDRVTPGTIVVVRPGEKIPLDGRVVAGASEVNQAPVTGESLPVEKGHGDDVFAGSINGHGALDVSVTRVWRDTTLARIIHLVEQAQSTRAPLQTVVERFARVYTPSVLALAALVAVLPPLLF
ncbi:MAG: HAD-IC family P-type ATPase, partial [Acidobacteriaceae bacterium]|nr:HAD-IC family P-type ATPase [Acidobacteriaceae bacterium]